MLTDSNGPVMDKNCLVIIMSFCSLYQTKEIKAACCDCVTLLSSQIVVTFSCNYDIKHEASLSYFCQQ